MSEHLNEKDAAVTYRSRYQVCDDCECVTIVQRNDARGVPDETEWDQFPRCMVCGGSMLHWDADEKSQDDIYWAKGIRAGEAHVLRGRRLDWEDLAERLDEEVSLGGDGASLVEATRAWLSAQGGEQ